MKKGLYIKFLSAFWLLNCVFWIQFFNSDFLSNLTFVPRNVIDSIDDVIHYKHLKILIRKTEFLYNYILKDGPLENKFDFVTHKQVQSYSTINKILSEKYVFVGSETDIDKIIMFMPPLPLYKSKNSNYIGISSVLFNKLWDDPIKKKILIK